MSGPDWVERIANRWPFAAAGEEVPLIATYQSGGVLAQYDVHPDGQRFVIATPASSNRLAVITGVLANLKR